MASSISKKRKFVADGVFFAELNEVLTRELAEDGYSGVEVRVTPMRTEFYLFIFPILKHVRRRGGEEEENAAELKIPDGHAKKPDLAREVFEMMGRSGIVPNLNSDILVLQSYLKSGRFSDALNFFSQLRHRRKIGRKLYNTVVVGLSKARKSDIALDFLWKTRANVVLPSIECFEELILALYSNEQYDLVVKLVEDLEKCGRNLSSFISNVLWLHSLKT